jgi:hypothetical protein
MADKANLSCKSCQKDEITKQTQIKAKIEHSEIRHSLIYGGQTQFGFLGSWVLEFSVIYANQSQISNFQSKIEHRKSKMKNKANLSCKSCQTDEITKQTQT